MAAVLCAVVCSSGSTIVQESREVIGHFLVLGWEGEDVDGSHFT